MIGLSCMEHGQSADSHIQDLTSILGVDSKDISMAKFLVINNCRDER